jgi:Spy/CpxP family protein refolding chaperone
MLILAMAFLALACAPNVNSSGSGYATAQMLTSGSGARQFRQKAIESIPYGELNEATQQKLKPVLNSPSIYRRLPITAIDTDPDYFRFLIRYPEVVIEIWKLMGVTKMDVNRTAPYELDSNDGAGTISHIELVYGNDSTHIFYAEGTYEGPVLRRKLKGRCVLVLRTEHSMDANQKSKAVNQLDVFMKVDNATVGVVAKTLQPLVGSTADHNFTESLKFLQRLYETTARNGGGVQNMAERLELTPDVRQQFQRLAGMVYQRAQATETKPANNEPLSAPPARIEGLQQASWPSTGAAPKYQREYYR